MYRECENCGASLDPGEICDCRTEETNLPAILCVQKPVIVENLDSVRNRLEGLISEVVEFPQDDESLKKVKKLRADLNKEKERYEAQRKEAKQIVLADYKRAEKKYEEYISGPYYSADRTLKEWVDNYQNGIKQKCEADLRAYFDELCLANGIDFIPFHRCGVCVDMAMARQKEPRKAMDAIYNFVKAVRADMDTIAGMENAGEVMAEYRKYPVLSEAVLTVTRRKQELEKSKAYLAQQQERKRQQDEIRAALMEAAPEVQPEPEERYSVCFRASGTLSALKAMKAHSLALGITFEEIEQEEENNG
ncbi:MAG: hypothetical protein Q4F81_05070 [Eubacteriales bacterium]|nr:hypothetical protein [Eubacteriales bacterium]